MFKNMLKRSWLSIARKPSRAIILGLILFAMANLVLASIAIKGAVQESTDYAKSSLGGTVYLQPDISKLRNSLISSGATTPTPGQALTITRPEIKIATVSSIANSAYVKDYAYGLNSKAKASSFTPITNTDSNKEPNAMVRINGDSTEAALTSDTNIQGINSYAFISQVSDGTMSLSSGTYFDENTDNKVIISYDLATSNSLKVGDNISLQNIYSEDKISLEVIGIYDLSENSGFSSNSNNIYMNVKTASQFLSSSAYNNGDYSVSNVRYYLNNAENSDAFIAEANQKYPNLSEDNLTLSIDKTAYEKMVGPIESVGSFATTILWIVVIASIAIVTLIVTINVKDRRYEMGVLLSLGAKKANVIGQIFTELLVVGTIAFVLSLGTSTLLAKNMSQGLLDSQIVSSETESSNNFGRPGLMGGGFNRQSSNVEAINEINVNATAIDYVILFAVGYGVVVLSLLLPAWGIVKYQPKTILSGKE